MKIIYVFSVTLLFYSCNPAEKGRSVETKSATDTLPQKKMDDDEFSWADKYLTDPCLNSGGMANFIIKYATATKMIENFKLNYNREGANNRPIATLTKNFFVDASDIEAVNNFLTHDTSYDGVRLHFGVNPTAVSNPNSEYKYTTELYFFPTKPVGDPTEHSDNWAYMNPRVTSPYIVKRSDDIKNRILLFESEYYNRRPSDPATLLSLSKSVWIDACVWKYMNELVNNTHINGFDFSLAGYSGDESHLPRGARVFKKASTVVIIPTVNKIRDTKIIDKLMEKKNINPLNHGELCPDNCPRPVTP